jgi:hypothetical protein
MTDPRRMAFYANSKGVFLKTLQRLAHLQHLLYAHTMEHRSGVAFRYSDSGTEGSRWQAH